MRFALGDAVRLTPTVKAVCLEPKKYELGIVTDDSGSWNIYSVKWNGIDHPIGMRADEIVLVKDGANGRHE